MRAAVVLATGLACFVAGAAEAGPASDVVRLFYTTQIGQEADRTMRGHFTDAARARLDANERTTEKGESGCIDFGLALDAQDYDEEEVGRTLELDEAVDGDRATVTARFNNFDESQSVVWMLRDVGGTWLVSDIASGDWKLSELDCGG